MTDLCTAEQLPLLRSRNWIFK